MVSQPRAPPPPRLPDCRAETEVYSCLLSFLAEHTRCRSRGQQTEGDIQKKGAILRPGLHFHVSLPIFFYLFCLCFHLGCFPAVYSEQVLARTKD